MIFSIDHLVIAVDRDLQAELTRRLPRSGFRDVSFTLPFEDDGVVSDSLAYAGGGFTELLCESDPSRSPQVWFAEGPRVTGLGFASDDFDADTTWDGDPEAWIMHEDLTLPDGAPLHIHAAGPHRHRSPFYVFVMDRPDGRLEFPDTTGARLVRLTLEGADAELWRDRLVRWLRLPLQDGQLRVADVAIEFVPGPDEGVALTPTFAVPAAPGRLALARGAIELVAEPSA
jgi:hypothetical protein